MLKILAVPYIRGKKVLQMDKLVSIRWKKLRFVGSIDFKRKCAHVHKQLYSVYTHETPSLTTRKLLKVQWWKSLKQTAISLAQLTLL